MAPRRRTSAKKIPKARPSQIVVLPISSTRLRAFQDAVFTQLVKDNKDICPKLEELEGIEDTLESSNLQREIFLGERNGFLRERNTLLEEKAAWGTEKRSLEEKIRELEKKNEDLARAAGSVESLPAANKINAESFSN